MSPTMITANAPGRPTGRIELGMTATMTTAVVPPRPPVGMNPA